MSRPMKLYNDDCLKIMKTMGDDSVDIIITDPPYGTNAGKYNTRRGIKYGNSRARSTDYGEVTWDNEIPSKEYFDEMQRISKNQVIFGGNYFSNYLAPSPCWIIWDKDNGANNFADCELAWCSFTSAIRKIKYKWHGFLQEDMMNKEVRIHPTQKPVRVFEWILERYATKGQTVLDPFMGSGSTAIAAQNLGFDFIGVEINSEYFDMARKRIEYEMQQHRLCF